MILAATGHRPDKLGGYASKTHWRLIALARDYLSDRQPSAVIVGMALGWDQAVAQAAIDFNIPFTAAIPFEGQERRWPETSQARYHGLLDRAASVEIISPYCDILAYQHRNEWMVDRADEIAALWDGSWGGTFNCVRYAEKVGKPVENLWPKWHNDFADLLQ